MKFAFLILVSFTCCASSMALIELDEAKTHYPIVLIPGLFGFESLFGYSYFGQLPERLVENGAKVYVAKHSSAHDVETRGEQIYQLLKEWGHERYNLVGHSLGGLDARYVLDKYPQLVASITTVATPHRGSKVADFLVGNMVLLPIISSVFWRGGDLVAHFVGILSGNVQRQDFKAAMKSLTSKTAENFNEQHQAGIASCEDNRCELFSCGTADVKPAGIRDLCSHALKLMGSIFYGNQKNDGLVAKSSMAFGKWIGDISGAHHLFPSRGSIFSYSSHL